MEPLTFKAESRKALPNAAALVALVFGTAFAALTPRLGVPDEASHFYRAYTVSSGHCIGAPAVLAPVLWEEMGRRHIWIQLDRDTAPKAMVELVRAGTYSSDAAGAFAVGNLYHCAPYLPGAAGIAGARLFGGSPAAAMYAGRITNLLFYAAMLRLAIALLPAYGSLIAAVALTPMALHQAGSLSADNPAIALSLVFCAYVLRHAAPGEPLSRKQLAIVAGLVVALAFVKTLLYLAALLLLLPESRFGTARRRWAFLGGCAAAGATALVTWRVLNADHVARVAALRAESGILMSSNLEFAMSSPLVFLGWVGRSIASMGGDYLEQFVGRLGWASVPIPAWLAFAYLAATAAIVCASGKLPLRLWQRLLAAAVFLTGVVSTFLVVWSFEIPTSSLSIPNGTIPGFQGRYLLPWAFPLLAALSARLLPDGRWMPALALAAALAANGAALHALQTAPVQTYAPPAAHFPYEGKLVRRPGFSVEDQKVYFVEAGRKRWIASGDWIRRHGLRWPRDVHVIAPEELAAIPEGAPLH